MFLDKDLIGEQQDIELFNNIGNLGNLEGRLTVLLTISPTPRLNWEFEAARGEYTHDSLSLDSPPNQLTSWNEANPQFILENPRFTFRGEPRRLSRGYAEQAFYGDIDADAHYFEFYLLNTDFLRNALGGELVGNLANVLRILKCESFKAEIGNNWSVELTTDQKALDWLNPKAQNRGSMVILKIRLFQTQQSSKRIQDLLVMSLADSRKIISDLCLMLSYANGGYIKSVYTIAQKFSSNEINSTSIENVASLAEAPIISPQEELGGSFIRYGIKDLLVFIQCFPAFQKMLQTPHWQEKWIVILEWYFQATLKPSGRRRNALIPVVANALGTLLENLARIILVTEGSLSDKRFKNLSLKERIEHLHIRIGLSGDTSVIEDFKTIRNNSTHAKSNPIPLNEIQQWEVVLKAVQWVDEVILWRLGYRGQYLERNLRSVSGINPRYDLSLCDSSW